MSGPAKLDDVLAALRSDRDGTLKAESAKDGWPLLTDQGWLFVSTKSNLSKLAGDHDQWMPEPMTVDQGFAWIVEPMIPMDDHYKFTDGQTYAADSWSRSVNYDSFGEISIARATGEHLDRWFGIADGKLAERTVRVWVPAGAITHELYVHDGQNLFDPEGPWGGWHLQDSAPDGMLLIGIDNTPARMDEYTHVTDVISGGTVGGKADDYADFLQHTVRPLVQKQYGEPGPVGVMGSSLGGLISFEVAYRYPNDFAFAASLSGTMGWGSIGAGVHNQTMIERYDGLHMKPVLYLDSGGEGITCADSDNDGIDDDDANASDNYCENAQMHESLGKKYMEGVDLFFWHEPGAEHNEAAWAARVFRPLQIFQAL
ncbi:MAG: alpha/beta hydrolase-fold protein [Minicystis sp.]